MLKAIVSHSKKVPVPGQQYSSQSYHLSLETEISDGLSVDRIQQKIHDTFELVKTAVEQELQSDHRPKEVAKQPPPPATASSKPATGSSPPVQSAQQAKPAAGKNLATNAQIKYICDMSQRKGLDINFINDVVRKEYGVESLYALNKQQASAIVDRLKDTRSQKAA